MDVLTSLFQKYFPNKVIYPAIGNHEGKAFLSFLNLIIKLCNQKGAPCNIFPPPYVKEDNIDWLYTSLAKNWTSTGLPQDLVPDIQKYYYYRIIKVNEKIRL